MKANKNYRIGNAIRVVGLWLLTCLLAFSFRAQAQTLYTWVTDGDGDWKDASNWNPRGIPGGDAIVKFNHDGVYFVSGIPADLNVLGMLFESKGTTFLSVEAPDANILIGIEDEPTCVFRIAEAATMIIWGANNSKWFVNRGIEGCIRGTLAILGADDAPVEHSIESLGLPGLKFRAGSRFIAGNGFQRLLGHPFGTNQTEEPLITFEPGSKFIQNDGLDPFGPSMDLPQVTFLPGSIFEYADNLEENKPGFIGRNFPDFVYAGFINKTVTGRGIVKFGNFELKSGSLTFAFDGGTTNQVQITGNVFLKVKNESDTIPSLIFAPLNGLSKLVFMGTDTQFVKGYSAIHISGRSQMTILSGSRVCLGTTVLTSKVLSTGGGEVLVQENAYLALEGEARIKGQGRFSMRANSTIGIGSKYGIMAAKDSGNIQTAIRIYGQGVYRYIGSTNQVTGDGLLNWNATFPMPTIVVATEKNAVLSLSASRRLGGIVFESGKLNTNGLTLSLRGLTVGGPNNGPTPAFVTGIGGQMESDSLNGSILFEGLAKVSANNKLYLANITLGNGIDGPVDFGKNDDVSILGNLKLLSNTIQLLNPPYYAVGSTLIYAAANATFQCGKEWVMNADEGKGIPYHVQIGIAGITGTKLSFSGVGGYWHNEGIMSFKGNLPGVVLNAGVKLSIGPSNTVTAKK